MKDIFMMTSLGLIAGFMACFWTRLIKTNMIFRKFGRWLTIMDNRHIIEHNEDSMVIKFIRCAFCLQAWVVFALSLFYIITYEPYWIFATIGVFGALGAGNFICEMVITFRNEA